MTDSTKHVFGESDVELTWFCQRIDIVFRKLGEGDNSIIYQERNNELWDLMRVWGRAHTYFTGRQHWRGPN